MEYLIHNLCKTHAFRFFILIKDHFFRALKNQMTLVQTLSDSNQTKLDTNEQEIEQVKSFSVCFSDETLFVVSNRN
jgi:hypothetical protein